MYTVDQTYLQAAAGMQSEQGKELQVMSGGVFGYNLVTLVDTKSDNPNTNRVSARQLPGLLSVAAELVYPSEEGGGYVELFRHRTGISMPLDDALCQTSDTVTLLEFGDLDNDIHPDTTECALQPDLTNWLIHNSGLEIPEGIVVVTRPMSYYEEAPSTVAKRRVPPFHIIFESTAQQMSDSRRLRPTIIINGPDSETPFTEPEVLLGKELIRDDGFKINLDIRTRGTVRCPVTGLDPITGEILSDGPVTAWQEPRNLAKQRGRKGVEVGVYGAPILTRIKSTHATLSPNDKFELIETTAKLVS